MQKFLNLLLTMSAHGSARINMLGLSMNFDINFMSDWTKIERFSHFQKQPFADVLQKRPS